VSRRHRTDVSSNALIAAWLRRRLPDLPKARGEAPRIDHLPPRARRHFSRRLKQTSASFRFSRPAREPKRRPGLLQPAGEVRAAAGSSRFRGASAAPWIIRVAAAQPAGDQRVENHHTMSSNSSERARLGALRGAGRHSLRSGGRGRSVKVSSRPRGYRGRIAAVALAASSLPTVNG